MSENACGGASSSSTDTDKDSSVECPDCDSSFGTYRGMTVHHGMAHDGSVGYITLSCQQCEVGYEVKKHKSESSRFCSRECHGSWQSENRTGENSPTWEGGEVTVECEVCNQAFKVKRHIAKSRRFCSFECMGVKREDEYSRQRHPNWKGGKVELECSICGDGYSVKQCRAKESVVCSLSCAGKWNSKHNCGESHYNYKGGDSLYRGRNWNRQKKKARKRDSHECQICGKGEVDNGRKLPVHHKTPLRTFIGKDGKCDFDKANSLQNLITLCDSCHGRVERYAPLIPDLR